MTCSRSGTARSSPCPTGRSCTTSSRATCSRRTWIGSSREQTPSCTSPRSTSTPPPASRTRSRSSASTYEGTERVARACAKVKAPASSSSRPRASTASPREWRRRGVLGGGRSSRSLPTRTSKRNAEKLLLCMAQEGHALPSVTLQLRDHLRRVHPACASTLAINKFVWQACMGLPLTVWKTALDQKRPYLDLKDAGLWRPGLHSPQRYLRRARLQRADRERHRPADRGPHPERSPRSPGRLRGHTDHEPPLLHGRVRTVPLAGVRVRGEPHPGHPGHGPAPPGERAASPRR